MARTCIALVAAAVALGPISAGAATLNASNIDWSGVSTVGFDGDGTPDSGSRTDPDNALGAPDGAFLSLGLGGIAVFDFGEDFLSPASVLEVTFGCSTASDPGCTNHPEQVDIYVGNSYVLNSFDLSGFTLVDTVANADAQGGLSISFAGIYSFLALVDRSADLGSISKDGFDVDSVSVTPVPVPPALPLFVAALFGAGFLVRRRKAG